MVTYEQIMARYGVCQETIRRWVKSGNFPVPRVRQGRTILWLEDDLEKFDAGKGPEATVIDQREMEDLLKENDATWTSNAAEALGVDEGRVTPEAVVQQMRASLGLSADASDLQVLGATLDLLRKYRGLRQAIIQIVKVLGRLV